MPPERAIWYPFWYELDQPKFTMSDGRVLLVEAEETLGLVYEWPKPINDWRVLVEMEPA